MVYTWRIGGLRSRRFTLSAIYISFTPSAIYISFTPSAIYILFTLSGIYTSFTPSAIYISFTPSAIYHFVYAIGDLHFVYAIGDLHFRLRHRRYTFRLRHRRFTFRLRHRRYTFRLRHRRFQHRRCTPSAICFGTFHSALYNSAQSVSVHCRSLALAGAVQVQVLVPPLLRCRAGAVGAWMVGSWKKVDARWCMKESPYISRLPCDASRPCGRTSTHADVQHRLRASREWSHGVVGRMSTQRRRATTRWMPGKAIEEPLAHKCLAGTLVDVRPPGRDASHGNLLT